MWMLSPMSRPASEMWISSGMWAASQTRSSSWRTTLRTPPRLMPGDCFFVVEAHGDGDGQLAVLADAQEIDVDRPARHRMELDVLGQRAVRLAAGVDHHHRVHEVAGREHLGEELLLDMHRHRLFLVAVDHGGDPSVAAQCTGGSLASPFARFSGQRQLFAHCLFSRNKSRHASRDDHGSGRARTSRRMPETQELKVDPGSSPG